MELDVLENLLFATIRSGTPLLYVALGVLITERAGVLNLGQEGMMLMGAVTAFIATHGTDNHLLGLIAGAGAGVATSLLFAVATLTLRANQVASGLALTITGTGMAAFIGVDYVGDSIKGIAPLNTPLLRDLPLVGKALFGQDILVYLSLALALLLWFVINRWRVGLILSAVGENPYAANKLGIGVIRTRYLAVMAGGALAGLGGAYLSLSYTPLWNEGVSAGRGWIALALVVFASWRLGRVLLGAYLFGMAGILNLLMQGFGWSVPSNLLAMMPYVLTIVVLVILAARNTGESDSAPRSLGQIYHPEN